MCLIDNCSTCFKEITKKNKCTTKCNHIFCLECMLIYFQQENKCPLCRSNLLPNEKYRRNSRESFETLISGNSRILENIRIVSEIFSYNTGLVNLSGIESNINDDFDENDDDDDEVPDLIEDDNNNYISRYNSNNNRRYLI
jgi:hypothetical protein